MHPFTKPAQKQNHYLRSHKVRGSRLSPGMWIDLPDRIGACAIKSIEIPGDWLEVDPGSPVRHVRFWGDGADDFVAVDASDRYAVVNPDSVIEGERPDRLRWLTLVVLWVPGRN